MIIINFLTLWCGVVWAVVWCGRTERVWWSHCVDWRDVTGYLSDPHDFPQSPQIASPRITGAIAG